MTQENTQLPQPAPESADGFWRLRGTFPVFVDLLVLFGIFFLTQIVVGMTVALLMGLKIADLTAMSGAEQLKLGNFNAITYLLSMALTVAGFLWYRKQRGATGILARFSKRGFHGGLLLWGICFAFAASIVIEPLLGLLPAVPDLYGRGIWVCLMMIVAAPLFEEFLFRGVLLEALRAKYGVWMAVSVSALCFGIVHGYPAVAVNAFVLGLVMGFIYIKSGSLWTPIVIHAANNALGCLLMIVCKQDVLLRDAIGSRWLYVLLYVVAAAVFVISGYKMICTLRSMAARDKNREAA